MAIPSEVLAEYTMGSEEILDFSINWSTRMTAEGVSASTSTWTVAHGPAVLGTGSNGAPAPSLADNVATAWIVNGTVGDVYYLTNKIVTSSPARTLEGSIKVTVIDR